MTPHGKTLGFGVAAAVACILLLPLLAMLFTDEVTWSAFDFLVAGVLLLAAGLSYAFFARTSRAVAYRWTVGAVIAVVLAIVWLELAVGIFETPWAGS